MYQLKSMEDTIAAIATAAGESGIGVVRLSGDEAIVIADKMFKPGKRKSLKEQDTYTAHYGWIVRKSGRNIDYIDEAVVTLMKAPHSFTKEDVVEISSHGSVVSLRQILDLALASGARLAEPGEFTKRAFLNGRIDLAQAEAILDIITCKTDAFLKASTGQLKGDLSLRLGSIREEIMKAYVEIEAIVNFPEDDSESKNLKRINDRIRKAADDIAALLNSSKHGRLLKEGIKIVICGRPNVGKSSLLNALLKQPRAIVTDIAGTTRDTIEEYAQIGGLPMQLIDTAGILEPRDLIEAEAIKRSHAHMDAADMVMFVLDNAQLFSPEDNRILSKIKGQQVLIVINKCDLERKLEISDLEELSGHAKMIEISALKKEGIEKLEQCILETIEPQSNMDTHGVYISNLRHIQALNECQAALHKAAQLIADKISIEFVSEELKAALNHLDAITGRNIDADLIDQIFSQFCIGK